MKVDFEGRRRLLKAAVSITGAATYASLFYRARNIPGIPHRNDPLPTPEGFFLPELRVIDHLNVKNGEEFLSQGFEVVLKELEKGGKVESLVSDPEHELINSKKGQFLIRDEVDHSYSTHYLLLKGNTRKGYNYHALVITSTKSGDLVERETYTFLDGKLSNNAYIKVDSKLKRTSLLMKKDDWPHLSSELIDSYDRFVIAENGKRKKKR